MATLLKIRANPAPSQPSPAVAPQTVVVGGGGLVGRQIGSYTILRELGQGGMGCVYLGEHALIGRKAAIKVLNPDIASDAEVVSRFFTEARAVNDIRHPNIVEVTDFGQFGSLYCIVMEYLDGETLAARLTHVRTFDEVGVVRIMKQCTSALAAAHHQGLVHRDIKPENIFLRAHPDYPDFVKLLDFGIAKLLGPEASVGHHTKTGSVLGTPSYMSPEQCLGEAALDIRSDVYSLGVVIYQMLTGLLPFTADTLGRLIVCHVSEAPVPPLVIKPSLSRPMNDLVMRALQKNPGHRYQSAREMREALERVLAPHARVATPAANLLPPLSAAVTSLERSAPPVARGGELAEQRFSATPATSLDAPGRELRSAARGATRAPYPHRAEPDHNRRLTAIVLDRIAGGQLDLPELSPATIRCIELASNGSLGFTDAANILKEVPALRSRVMRLANSAAFPSKMPATTLEMAVGRLGSQGLYGALLEFAGREALEGSGRATRVKEAMRRIWPHALGTALLTAELCQAQGRAAMAPQGYLAGLLANVGKPVVGTLLLEIEQHLKASGNRSLLPESAFLAVMESTAHMAGGAVARRWQLPGAVAVAIERSRTWDADQPLALSNLVRFSGAVSCRVGLTVGLYDGVEIERVFGEGRALLKLDEPVLKRLSHGLKERVTVLAAIRG